VLRAIAQPRKGRKGARGRRFVPVHMRFPGCGGLNPFDTSSLRPLVLTQNKNYRLPNKPGCVICERRMSLPAFQLAVDSIKKTEKPILLYKRSQEFSDGVHVFGAK